MSDRRTAYISGSFVSLAPYRSSGCLPDLIDRVDDCCQWIEDELKQPLRGRINDYKKLLSRHERIRGRYSDEMHSVLQSVSELATLVDIAYFLREQSSEEFRAARKVEQLQASDLRIAVLEAQLAESQARVAEPKQASARVDELCTELRQHKAVLEAQLDSAKGATTLEERLAKLDKAVFSNEKPGQPDAQAAEPDLSAAVKIDYRASILMPRAAGYIVAAMQLKTAVACSKLNDAPKLDALGSEFVRLLPKGASNKFTSKKNFKFTSDSC